VGKAVSVSLRVNPNFAVMYTKPVKRFMLKHKWAQIGGSIAAGVADGFGCSGACSAAFSAYLTDISGGSYGDIGKSALTSYASYSLTTGIDSPFDYVKGTTQFSATQMTYLTLAHGAVGGSISKASGGEFSKGFKLSAGMKLLSMTAQNMRAEQLRQSAKNPAANLQPGLSEGVNGDGHKLAGNRRTYDKFGVPLPNEGPSYLGGFQGKSGSIFGRSYSSGGIVDNVMEAFSGPHDTFNDWVGWYDAMGNGKDLSGLHYVYGQFMNYSVNLISAAPFAAATLMPSHTVMYLNSQRD
jgi:hypothetical protein